MDSIYVRYGVMRYRGALDAFDAKGERFVRGDRLVICTPRGHELATALCQLTDETIADFSHSQKGSLSFVRRATRADLELAKKLDAMCESDFKRCRKIVVRMKIKLTLARVERILGQERMIVYYVADGRVDFRELVRALAAEFQTRIEMKQIGARDETRLLADVGDCGREICCRSFLTSMPPVSMKLVKLQKSTLDPTKVTGRCGKLKCCLRFEHDYYKELYQRSPAIGRRVRLGQESGRVVAQELIARRVVVEFEDGRRASVGLDELDPSYRYNSRANLDALDDSDDMTDFPYEDQDRRYDRYERNNRAKPRSARRRFDDDK